MVSQGSERREFFRWSNVELKLNDQVINSKDNYEKVKLNRIHEDKENDIPIGWFSRKKTRVSTTVKGRVKFNNVVSDELEVKSAVEILN